MANTDGKETCGRCSTSTVVEAVTDEDGPEHDPFDGGHIEVEERELRLLAAPAVLFGRVKHRIDTVAARFVYR